MRGQVSTNTTSSTRIKKWDYQHNVWFFDLQFISNDEILNLFYEARHIFRSQRDAFISVWNLRDVFVSHETQHKVELITKLTDKYRLVKGVICITTDPLLKIILKSVYEGVCFVNKQEDVFSKVEKIFSEE